MITTLKQYFKYLTVFISILWFVCFYLFSNYMYNSMNAQESERISDTLSKQIFGSMYQIMRKGWSRDDLQSFLASVENSFDNASYSVQIHRGTKVEALFGTIKEAPASAEVLKAFATGEKIKYDAAQTLSTLTPIKAKQECLSCHTNAHPGDVLGVIAVAYDYSQSDTYHKRHFLIMMLLLLPLMLFISYLIAHHAFNRINRSLQGFREKIGNINSVKEFKSVNITTLKSGFEEFDTLMNEFDELSRKLKDIAVDKEILEFEVKLLDKLIITSDVVRDWKEHIHDLLHDINSVMPIYSLTTIFESENGLCEIEIFWPGRPSDECRTYMEKAALELLEAHPSLDITNHSIRHNYGNENYCLTTLVIDNIKHEAKSLILDTPKIGGVIGLGLQSELSNDAIFSIVIDSILTTLINLVGSVKAIHKYTDSLEYYATRDPLTGLFNQRVFRDLIGYEVKRAERHEYKFGLLVIDCDNFKPINDTYGHSFGDTFLKAFADLLSHAKRDEDILSRYGGDEFTLIIPESNKEEVFALAHRILRNADEFRLSAPDGAEVHITASIGMAIYPDHSNDAGELFNVADSMMYRSKEEGKNAIRFPSQDDLDAIYSDSNDKAMLVLDAIKYHRIIPHFQPIMSLKDNATTIHELLMRIDIDNNTITAGNFIEKAEALGVIHQMDYIVIEKAFEKIHKIGYNGVLFINLSPKALIVNEFIAKINTLIHTYGIEKRQIVFEITERETVKSFALLEKFVNNLKLEGYRFAIDDFGSGFSSFHYIKKFPIDFIKIDGEFIINITSDKKDLAFVKSIVSLAKELKVQTIAEFVENEEVLAFLREIGIDYVQGFHIGKPSLEFTR